MEITARAVPKHRRARIPVSVPWGRPRYRSARKDFLPAQSVTDDQDDVAGFQGRGRLRGDGRDGKPDKQKKYPGYHCSIQFVHKSLL
jgi:hypothetical protein